MRHHVVGVDNVGVDSAGVVKCVLKCAQYNCKCLINSKDPIIVLCGHQRFCESCAETVHQHGDRCPLCRADITMILRLY